MKKFRNSRISIKRYGLHFYNFLILKVIIFELVKMLNYEKPY